MKLLALGLDLLIVLFRVALPGGVRAVAAENFILRQQLGIQARMQIRAPNLPSFSRFVLGFFSLFVSARRLPKLAVVIAQSTLINFHKAMVQRKYQKLFSNRRKRPGPKGLRRESIELIIEIK